MRISKFLTVVCLVLVFASFPMIVFAASPSLQDAPVPVLEDLLTTLKNLGGVAVLFAALTNVGKGLGWVTDGNAPAVSLGMNTFGLVALVALQLTGKIDLVPALDQGAGAIANVINAILALIFQLYISRKGHDNVLAGLPVIGTSFSHRRAGEGPAVEITETRVVDG